MEKYKVEKLAQLFREYARPANNGSNFCLARPDRTIPPPTQEVFLDTADALEEYAATLSHGDDREGYETLLDVSEEKRMAYVEEWRARHMVACHRGVAALYRGPSVTQSNLTIGSLESSPPALTREQILEMMEWLETIPDDEGRP